MSTRRQVTINGTSYEIECPDDEPLLWVLRDRLGLVGTRFGCGDGECGACTVLVGGRSVSSCSVQIGDVRDPVVTVEGVAASDGTLHAVQQAFIEWQVGQCGYCLSGLVVTAVALVEAKGVGLTEVDVRTALDPHLCRCGDHTRIVAAVLAAAGAAE
jgi:aerobic-type carbon monoxide dehydrogenase small subunit (CoxS/CutS family)